MQDAPSDGQARQRCDVAVVGGVVVVVVIVVVVIVVVVVGGGGGGIHVLATQNGLGEVLIGDSHEYGMEFDSVERAAIEELIPDYFATMLDLPDLPDLPDPTDPTIAERWHGTYAKRTSGQGEIIAQPEDGVTIVSCGGGTGMTMSFGLAEHVWDGIEGGALESS